MLTGIELDRRRAQMRKDVLMERRKEVIQDFYATHLAMKRSMNNEEIVKINDELKSIDDYLSFLDNIDPSQPIER